MTQPKAEKERFLNKGRLEASNDHPPVDASLDRPGRFREALSVLDRRWADLNKEEDDGEARFLRNQALGHLEKSRQWIKKAIADKEFDRRL